jgi:2,4-dienoyl-CoA reductase-like NADH-dependent reductase (Old Yellow Enzyme family)
MAALFEPLTLRELTIPNRILVSPMCEYSSTNGFATDWHLVHLGGRAVGGAGLVFTEATAVTPEGRISPEDLGIWSDAHVDMLSRITHFIRGQRRASGMQLAHAGRKGSTKRPWEGTGAVERDGWEPIAPQSVPFAENFPVPRELDTTGIRQVVQAFRDAGRRARAAGFDVVEVHAAHGYLLHEFMSPASNTRTDDYGGSFENRIRLCLEVVEAVREVWPERLPVFVRISCTDWVDGGWDIEQSIGLARALKLRGVDLIDCSSGGNIAHARVPIGPGYHVPFAERIRREAGIATGVVGLITEPAQANLIVAEGRADCVLMARELLRDPYFPLRAARELGVAVDWPAQYLRAAPPQAPSRGDGR